MIDMYFVKAWLIRIILPIIVVVLIIFAGSRNTVVRSWSRHNPGYGLTLSAGFVNAIDIPLFLSTQHKTPLYFFFFVLNIICCIVAIPYAIDIVKVLRKNKKDKQALV